MEWELTKVPELRKDKHKNNFDAIIVLITNIFFINLPVFISVRNI